jgi:CDP-4-dehydro-6-deoxyglucose reductase, E3
VVADHRDTDSGEDTAMLYTVRFVPLGDCVACRGDETVLAAILRSGAKVMFGCRGGGCGTCQMRLLSGRVEFGRCSTAVLPEEAKREGAFLSCQARPLSDLTVEVTPANKYRRPSDEYWLATLSR